MRFEWRCARPIGRLATVAAVLVCGAHPARGDSTVGTFGAAAVPGFPRLVGGAGSFGGRYSGGGRDGGPLLGVEGSWAATLPAQADPSQGAWGFGARAGWAFANGLALHARYDDLGVRPARLSAPLQLATAGLRYSLPMMLPLPFAEVDVGPAFLDGDVTFGAGAGLGASIPLGPYLLLDVVGRDWLVPVAGTLRHTLTVGLGLAVTFASPAR